MYECITLAGEGRVSDRSTFVRPSPRLRIYANADFGSAHAQRTRPWPAGMPPMYFGTARKRTSFLCYRLPITLLFAILPILSSLPFFVHFPCPSPAPFLSHIPPLLPHPLSRTLPRVFAFKTNITTISHRY